MDSPHTHDPQQGEALTALDPTTADAVVAVLSRNGVPAWQEATPDALGDVVVRVPTGMREQAMREMGQRMEEITAAVRGEAVGDQPRRRPGRTDADGDGRRVAPSDPDDVHAGPPLMMERFADLRLVVVVVLGPLLAVTIAGPFLPRSARVVVFLVIAAGLAFALARRRR